MNKMLELEQPGTDDQISKSDTNLRHVPVLGGSIYHFCILCRDDKSSFWM